MKITHCKLSKKVQIKFTQFFVAEVTARTAADLLEIHHNTAALFYHKISYNALDVSDFKHFRINHSKAFAEDHNHMGGIEHFWSQAKRILRKYNGIDKKHLHLFIKD